MDEESWSIDEEMSLDVHDSHHIPSPRRPLKFWVGFILMVFAVNLAIFCLPPPAKDASKLEVYSDLQLSSWLDISVRDTLDVDVIERFVLMNHYTAFFIYILLHLFLMYTFFGSRLFMITAFTWRMLVKVLLLEQHWFLRKAVMGM